MDGIQATNYVRRNGRLILRAALPARDRESWLSLWQDKFGNLEDFPWEEVFGRKPTTDELIRMGFATCPICGRQLV